MICIACPNSVFIIAEVSVEYTSLIKYYLLELINNSVKHGKNWRGSAPTLQSGGAITPLSPRFSSPAIMFLMSTTLVLQYIALQHLTIYTRSRT